MGRATRWLKGLLGGKKENSQNKEQKASEKKPEKSRWSFSKSGCDRGVAASVQQATPAPWISSMYNKDQEQNKHAIAVAAATAAAADAAVAAAQAAVEVVRLTSRGRNAMLTVRERLAAVKIQTMFRSYLARKALRALKALVKLQAIVRGNLVRKQAVTTLHCMQALIRVQDTARARRAVPRRYQPEFQQRRSVERLAETPGYSYSHRRILSIDKTSSYSERSPKIVEIDTYRPNWSCSRRICPDNPEDLQLVPLSSPLYHRPPRIVAPSLHDNYYETPRKHRGYSSTTNSTPRYNVGSVPPYTPTKGFGGAEPGYMAKTSSFEAKTRSYSAPRQRPETPRKSMVESRASMSGVERPCYKIQDGVDRSIELKDLYYQRKW